MASKRKEAALPAYEKLGAFYLGRVHDPARDETTDELLLYDAKDLTTHAVCVGMTGSGKTGLCVSLIEEAALDGVPAILLDPKGDLGNLLLTFPRLRAEDFEPWIDPAAAARKGRSVAEHAVETAKLWKTGLAAWGEDGARIERLRRSAEFTIYTPGSRAGRPLSLLGSFAVPPPALMDDDEAYREHLVNSAAGLLGLLGIDTDPLRSREHLLLTAICDAAWRDGRDLSPAELIRQIQQPPFETLGVLDLESVYPAKDRLALSMQLNTLLAAPGFASWSEGEPLDAGSLLWTAEGRPRISILSMAHLGEEERMYLVTRVLGELLSWMRGQSGTTSLRALLYMDEVFGFLPPTANPPSKRPMLTLLKQARAYGLGLVLATQNPVDLDYKALSNAGTWLIGRLQTERDKLRVLEGLEAASGASGSAFDRRAADDLISRLRSRVFLMNNVHDDHPALFHTRWAMSYLRGPLTREQIRRLAGDTAARPATEDQAETRKPAAARSRRSRAGASSTRPVLPPGIDEAFLPAEASATNGPLVYEGWLLGAAELHYVRQSLGVDAWRRFTLAVPAELAFGKAAGGWQAARRVEIDLAGLEREPAADALFEGLPAAARQEKTFAAQGKSLAAQLYQLEPLVIRRSKKLKLVSGVDESASEFNQRLQQAARELRDRELARLRERYAPKLARVQEQIARAQQRVEREQQQYRQQKMQTAISVGATLLGALFGRKAASVGTVGRAATALRGAGRAKRERGDVQRAHEQTGRLQLKLEQLEQEFEDKLAARRDDLDPSRIEAEQITVRARKGDTRIGRLVLLWVPVGGSPSLSPM